MRPRSTTAIWTRADHEHVHGARRRRQERQQQAREDVVEAVAEQQPGDEHARAGHGGNGRRLRGERRGRPHTAPAVGSARPSRCVPQSSSRTRHGAAPSMMVERGVLPALRRRLPRGSRGAARRAIGTPARASRRRGSRRRRRARRTQLPRAVHPSMEHLPALAVGRRVGRREHVEADLCVGRAADVAEVPLLQERIEPGAAPRSPRGALPPCAPRAPGRWRGWRRRPRRRAARPDARPGRSRGATADCPDAGPRGPRCPASRRDG